MEKKIHHGFNQIIRKLVVVMLVLSMSIFLFNSTGIISYADASVVPTIVVGDIEENSSTGKFSYPEAQVTGTVSRVMITIDAGSFSADSTYVVANQDLNGLSKTYNVADASEAQALIRSCTFTLASGKSEQSVTISLSGDVTDLSSLPSYANITITQHNINGVAHYYAYVKLCNNNDYNQTNSVSFSDAYAAAKGLTYNGLKGYLATITSQQEDQILDNITGFMGWGGGGRVDQSDAAINGDTFTKSSKVIPPKTGSSTWYWVCGPEAGNTFGYTNWTVGEPNGNINSASGEYLLMLHKLNYSTIGWNDIDNASYKMPGYFVEWSEDTRSPGESALYCEATVTNKKHTHTWNYSVGTGADANKLYAYCVNGSKCDYAGTTSDLSKAVVLTLNATSQSFTGNSVTANISADEKTAWKNALGTDAPDIVYYTDEVCTTKTTVGETTDATTSGADSVGGAPKNAGTYWAAISTGSGSNAKTAKVAFEIKQTGGGIQVVPAAQNLVYDGGAHSLLDIAKKK